MFMEIPERPVDLSTKIAGAGGAKAANEVSEGGVSAVGGVNPKVSEGASVAGNGKSPAAGQALLEMMSNPDGVLPVSGFSKGSVGKKERVTGDTIQAHFTALFTHGGKADKELRQLINLASRVPVSGERAPSSDILSGRDAMPGAGIINPEIIKQALISDAKANGIPIGTEEATERLVALFKAQP